MADHCTSVQASESQPSEYERFRATALVPPGSYDPETHTIGCVWYTGATVRRFGQIPGADGYPVFGEYDLVLSTDKAAVRLGRLNSHAPFLANHDADSLAAVIGKVVPGSARIEDGNCLARLALSSAPGDADVIQKVITGIIANLSVGTKLIALTRLDTPDEKRVRPLFRADDWEPAELSAVPIGADPDAHTLSHQTQEPDTMSTVNAPAELSPDLKAAERRAERERLAGIRTAFSILAKCTDEGDRAENERLLASCLDSDVSLADARAKFFDRRVDLDAKLAISSVQSTQIKTGHVSVGGSDENIKRGEALESCLLANAGIGKMPTDSENPFAREYRFASLSDIAAGVLRRNGMDVTGMSRDAIAGLALSRLGRSDDAALEFGRALLSGGAVSVDNLPYLLANTANKSLRKGYDAVPATYQQFCSLGEPLKDYKSRSHVLLGDTADLEELPEGATPKLSDINESNSTMQLKDYAKAFAVTRRAIVNDDLRGLTKIPMEFGKSAKRKENALAYAALIASGNYTAANTGTAGVPSNATLSELRKLLRKRTALAATGNTARPLNVQIKYLVVPPEHETAANAIVGVLYPASTSNYIDPAFRQLVVVCDAALTDANKWYVVADQAIFEGITYSYLAGENGVVVSSNPEWDSGNLVIQARLAFDVKVIDSKALGYNAGT